VLNTLDQQILHHHVRTLAHHNEERERSWAAASTSSRFGYRPHADARMDLFLAVFAEPCVQPPTVRLFPVAEARLARGFLLVRASRWPGLSVMEGPLALPDPRHPRQPGPLLHRDLFRRLLRCRRYDAGVFCGSSTPAPTRKESLKLADSLGVPGLLVVALLTVVPSELGSRRPECRAPFSLSLPILLSPMVPAHSRRVNPNHRLSDALCDRLRAAADILLSRVLDRRKCNMQIAVVGFACAKVTRPDKPAGVVGIIAISVGAALPRVAATYCLKAFGLLIPCIEPLGIPSRLW